jgi:hypothetical protein
MSDWDQFLAEVPWFLQGDETAVVGSEQAWQRGGSAGLPELSALLTEARLTPVVAHDTEYELLAWGPPDRRRGWLALPPHEPGSDIVHPTHRDFWRLCGGIVDWFRGPFTWWSNYDDVLTARALRLQPADVLADYAWLWRNADLVMPINPEAYYVAGIEANGNLTLVQRDTGELLLFAPDHAFEGVTPMEGCPPYSLLRINEVPDLGTWIEGSAQAWH